MHIGYVNYFLNLGKKVIICNSKFDRKVLKNLDCNRAMFGKYHNAIKQCSAKYSQEIDLISFYNKLKKLNPQFSNIKFNQFNFVVLVLEELGICKINAGRIEFTDVKSNLKNSNIYNFISLLLSGTKGV